MFFYMVKKLFRCAFSILCILMLFVGRPVSADIYQNKSKESYLEKVTVCKDDHLSVSFYCHPDWQVHHVDDAVIIVLSEEDPVMTLTVTRFDSNVRFLEQITSRMLKQRNLYEDGFQMERVTFAGRPSTKVKAFAKNNTQRRLVDYFLMEKDTLYGVLFTIEPKEDWEDHQTLVKDILDSIEFF